MATDGLVSVIIPTYYRDESLERTIECALSQKYSPIEIIVVDDSGERYAERICRNYDVQYIAHERNEGGNPARNTGIQHADGEYIQLLDDDDVIAPQKIALQVELLENSPHAEVAYGGVQGRNGERRYPSEELTGQDLKAALQHNWWTTITSSLLMSSDVLLDVYPLKAREAGDDIGMKIELARRTEFAFVDEILTELGDSGERRSVSFAIIREHLNIIDEYDFLYQQFPASVRRSTLSYTYRMEGHRILEQRYWSLASTKSFCKSLYYKDEIDPQLISAVFLSLLGLPGILLGKRVLKRIKRHSTV